MISLDEYEDDEQDEDEEDQPSYPCLDGDGISGQYCMQLHIPRLASNTPIYTPINTHIHTSVHTSTLLPSHTSVANRITPAPRQTHVPASHTHKGHMRGTWA